MVKGVNKSVIEMNCIDGGYFERAILFVNPEYSHLSGKRIAAEAKKFISTLDKELPPPYKKESRGPSAPQKWKVVLLSLLLSAVLLAAALLIFNKL